MQSISIIIPTYNSRWFIRRTLDSIFRLHGDVEVIVCDDGSTDGTVDICKKLPVRLFVNKINSGGPNWGRNKGLSVATGKYVCFLDHDDEINDHDWPVKQLELLTKYNTDIAICSYRNIPGGDVLSATKYFPENKAYELFVSHSKKAIKMIPGCVLIKKSICPYFTGTLSDYKWTAQLLKHRPVVTSGQVMINRHLHENNLSYNIAYKHETLSDQISIMDEASEGEKKLLRNGYRNLLGIIARRYFHARNFKNARYYLLQSQFTYKNIILFIASFIPIFREYIINNKNILGYAQSSNRLL